MYSIPESVYSKICPCLANMAGLSAKGDGSSQQMGGHRDVAQRAEL